MLTPQEIDFSIALNDCHVKYLRPRLALSLCANKLSQSLECPWFHKANNFPLLPNHILRLDLLHET